MSDQMIFAMGDELPALQSTADRYRGACKSQRAEPLSDPWRTTTPPRPRCNRIAGHDGPHRKYAGRDFRVLAEWTDAESVRPRQR